MDLIREAENQSCKLRCYFSNVHAGPSSLLSSNYGVSESTAHSAFGLMGYDTEAKRNKCFSKIQLVGQKIIETKHLLLVN